MTSFIVPGNPVQQGSMSAFIAGGKARVTHKNPESLKDYRARVAISARQAGAHCLTGPVAIHAEFKFTRPATHYGTGRNAENLKPSAPEHKTTAPDTDKLARSLLDALTGVAFADDKQVIHIDVRKSYASDPCTEVVIEARDRERKTA